MQRVVGPGMPGRGWCLLVVLIMAAWAWGSHGSGRTAIVSALPADQPVRADPHVSDDGSERMNPHSDLIFRATGASSCRDCHQVDRDQRMSHRVLDNELVRTLRAKARGIHGPGRFADCLRCHAGGKKGVEKY